MKVTAEEGLRKLQTKYVMNIFYEENSLNKLQCRVSLQPMCYKTYCIQI